MKLVLPSYLRPGTWLENLEATWELAWVEGVELLFFSYDEEARAILKRELAGIAALAGRFSYSLHLPDPLGPSDEELVELTRPFVGTYVLHPPRIAPGGGPPRGSGRPGAEAELADWAGLLESWRGRYGELFLLEYTGREDFAAAEACLPGLPLCADTGRLLLDGEEPAAWIGERGSRIGEIHLHGLAAGKDHAPLEPGSPWLGELAPFLAAFPGRVELELFSLEAALASASILGRALGPAKTESPAP